MINDSENIFYPVMTVNLSEFDYKSVGEFGQFTGTSLIKMMISYYNPGASEWEPLIEKVKVELMTNKFKGQEFNLIQFKSDFNVNISTQFMQTII